MNGILLIVISKTNSRRSKRKREMMRGFQIPTIYGRVLALIFIIFSLIGSSCIQNTYREYLPSNGSLFNIKFTYPSNWGRIIEKGRKKDRIIIYDPSKEVPDCTGINHCDSRPAILFDVFVIEPHNNWLEKQINQSRKIYERDVRLELINEEAIIIDSEDGWSFTVYNTEYNSITKSIIVQNEHRGYFFSIGLSSIEEMEGEFFAEFIELIDNLKFIDVAK